MWTTSYAREYRLGWMDRYGRLSENRFSARTFTNFDAACHLHFSLFGHSTRINKANMLVERKKAASDIKCVY